MVEALDTWNLDNEYDNVPDDDQSDIALISGSYEDGTLICR